MATFIKDPQDITDFEFDFINRLAAGQTIAAYTVTVEAGLTKVSDSKVGTVITVRLSGGTAETEYEILFHITSTDTQEFDATFTVLVQETSASVSGAPISKVDEAASNLLAIEEWREILGYHPWHFWQIAGSTIPVLSSCNTIVRQYAWQAADRIGRHEIAAAILAAEGRMTHYLGYAPAPHYVIETLPYPIFYDRQYDYLGNAGIDRRWRTVQLSEGYVQAVGVQTLLAIQVESGVVYSDLDGDGINETFTVSAATSVIDPEEIAVYFSACDRFTGDEVGERWRIRPINVTIAGGIVTVKGNAYQVAKPVLYEGVSSEQLDPTEATNFVNVLDIYRRYTSAGTTLDTAQAVLVWETHPAPHYGYGCLQANSSDPAGEYYSLARAGIHNKRLGIVDIGEALYDPTTETWSEVWDYGFWNHCRPPDRVIVRYLAGYPLERGQMASRYQALVARLAAAEMTRPICACESANRELYHWQFDLSRAAGTNDEQYAVSGDALTNPFGTRRGQVYAWREVMSNRLERGFAP